ncbi:hypothetical protein AAZV13_04G108300 [Glycine max]
MGCGENGLRVGIGWGKGCDLLQRLKGREGAQVLVVRAMVELQWWGAVNEETMVEIGPGVVHDTEGKSYRDMMENWIVGLMKEIKLMKVSFVRKHHLLEC